jgi:hypothetical protein
MNATTLTPAGQTRQMDTGLDIVTGAFSYSGGPSPPSCPGAVAACGP